MNTRKRNIVEGVSHVGQLLTVLPALASYINACYDEAAFLQAYESFMQNNTVPGNAEQALDEAGTWVLQGQTLRFVLQWEEGEMLYCWYVRCPDEATYLELKLFLKNLFSESGSG